MTARWLPAPQSQLKLAPDHSTWRVALQGFLDRERT
ncbi:MAG: hypothetical protein AW07_04210 [Candidatus Accumulibacter sp. SK-11]|nr:MAG: hypothetical protein AW07_04210 [Candidatus Accumulibacter sp. SK-11]